MKRTADWVFSATALGIFALIFGFIAVTSFTRQSPTIDEPIHLLGGYSYLKWGDFRVNPEHPPLIKMWAALPLMWLNINDPRSSSPYWSRIPETKPGGPVYPLAQDMFFVRNDATTLFFYAKVQMIILSIVLAMFIYLWTHELFGYKAGLASLFLYGLDPNILAHSTIVHTDVAFAAWVFIGTYFFWRALSELTWPNLLLASGFFGFAAITKHSFIAIVPVWIILGLIKVFGPEPQRCVIIAPSGTVSSRKGKMLLLLGLLACAAIGSYFAIWAAYGFRFNAVPTGGPPLFMTQVATPDKPIEQTIKSFILEHRLFPEAFIAGYLYNLEIWKHSAYLMGAISEDGFWSYFPVAFAVKTPVPTLLLLIAAAGMLFYKARPRLCLWLVLPPLVYFALAVLSRFNIGIRHLLPVYPFLFVLIGGTVAELWEAGSRIKRAGLVFLGLWYLWSSVSTYPHYLAFFNELAGGAKNGHKVLLDSNLDWGQDLKGLKKWLDDHAVQKIQLFYFGTADPKYYGIDDFYSTENLMNTPLSATREIELPDHLAVSANFFYGGELFLPKELAELLTSYKFDRPVTTIGYSVLVYKLNLADSRVYENSAVMAARKGAPNLAVALFHKALQINPMNVNAYVELGNFSARQGEWQKAIENYRAALKINPANDKVHFNLANALARQREFDAALSHYREAVRIRPGFAESYHNLGRILAVQGYLDQAIGYYREALRVRPEYAEAHESLGQALARQGRVGEAAHHYQEALRILKQSRYSTNRDP